MEEGLKKFEEEVQAKGVDERRITMNFAEAGEKKVTREGRGCAGLVQGEMRRTGCTRPAEKAKEKRTEEKVNTEERETREAKAFSRV